MKTTPIPTYKLKFWTVSRVVTKVWENMMTTFCWRRWETNKCKGSL